MTRPTFYPDGPNARGVSCNSSNRLPEVSLPLIHNAAAASNNGAASKRAGMARPGKAIRIRKSFQIKTLPTFGRFLLEHCQNDM